MGQADDDLARVVSRVARDYRFSDRERELLHLAASGIPRGAIAEQMGLSEATVKTLIRRMLAKRGGGAMTLHDIVGVVHRELFRPPTVVKRSARSIRASIPH